MIAFTCFIHQAVGEPSSKDVLIDNLKSQQKDMEQTLEVVWWIPCFIMITVKPLFKGPFNPDYSWTSH